MLSVFLFGCATATDFAIAVLDAAMEEDDYPSSSRVLYTGSPKAYCSEVRRKFENSERIYDSAQRKKNEYKTKQRRAETAYESNQWNRAVMKQVRIMNEQSRLQFGLRDDWKTEFKTNDGMQNCEDIDGYYLG